MARFRTREPWLPPKTSSAPRRGGRIERRDREELGADGSAGHDAGPRAGARWRPRGRRRCASRSGSGSGWRRPAGRSDSWISVGMPSERAASEDRHADVAAHADDGARAVPRSSRARLEEAPRQPGERRGAACPMRLARRSRTRARARAGSRPPGTSRVSSPCAVPDEDDRGASGRRARISRASAMPGKMCPPGPAGGDHVGPRSSSDRHAAAVRAHASARSTSCCETFRMSPAGDPGGDERRAAVGDERQRDSLGRHEREHDATG